MPSQFFPPADRTSQYYGAGNFTMSGLDKGLAHTTETAGGWPGYSGGGDAPNLTINPLTHRSRQHFPALGSARALVDPSSTAVRENRDRVFQFEITGYCDPRYAGSKYYVGAINRNKNGELDCLAELFAWLHEWGVPYRLPLMLPYPSSAGNSRARMSGPQYDAYRGFLGHQNASGNDHGDPGALDLAAIIRIAKGSNTALPTGGAGGAGGGGPKEWYEMAGLSSEVAGQIRKVVVDANREVQDWVNKYKLDPLRKRVVALQKKVDALAVRLEATVGDSARVPARFAKDKSGNQFWYLKSVASDTNDKAFDGHRQAVINSKLLAKIVEQQLTPDDVKNAVKEADAEIQSEQAASEQAAIVDGEKIAAKIAAADKAADDAQADADAAQAEADKQAAA